MLNAEIKVKLLIVVRKLYCCTQTNFLVDLLDNPSLVIHTPTATY